MNEADFRTTTLAVLHHHGVVEHGHVGHAAVAVALQASLAT
jgi:hypothetical protein